MNNYFYEMAAFLPEDVVVSLIGILRNSEKELLCKSIKDKELILDLLKSRVKVLPNWLSQTIQDNTIILTEKKIYEEPDWICIYNPFNQQTVRVYEVYFELDVVSDYDKTTLSLMGITLTLLNAYVDKHMVLAKENRHELFYAEMVVMFGMFYESLETKWSHDAMNKIREKANKSETATAVLELLSLKLKTGDLA